MSISGAQTLAEQLAGGLSKFLWMASAKTAGGNQKKTWQVAAATAARVLKVPLQAWRLHHQLSPLPSCGTAAADCSIVQQSSSPQAGLKMKGIKKVPSLQKYVYKQGQNRFRGAVGAAYSCSFAQNTFCLSRLLEELQGWHAPSLSSSGRIIFHAKQHGLGNQQMDQSGVKPGELLERLQVGLKVFNGYGPPDLENLAEEIKLSSSLWQSEPALPFLSTLGKYGPWRANLKARAQTWFSPGKPPARLQDLPLRTAGLLDILKGAVEDLQTTAWCLASCATVYLESSTSCSQGQ